MEQQVVSQTSTQTLTHEKRSDHRRRALKSGTFLFNKGYASYGCTVRNLNEGGAMVEMGETTGIPQQFDFRLSDEKPVPAQMIWRTKDRIGIKFSN